MNIIEAEKLAKAIEQFIDAKIEDARNLDRVTELQKVKIERNNLIIAIGLTVPR